MIGLTECQRREQYLAVFTLHEKEMFLRLTERCLHEDPSSRPSSGAVVEELARIRDETRKGSTGETVRRFYQFFLYWKVTGPCMGVRGVGLAWVAGLSWCAWHWSALCGWQCSAYSVGGSFWPSVGFSGRTCAGGSSQPCVGGSARPCVGGIGQPYVDGSGRTCVGGNGWSCVGGIGQPCVDGSGRTCVGGSIRPCMGGSGISCFGGSGISCFGGSGVCVCNVIKTFRRRRHTETINPAALLPFSILPTTPSGVLVRCVDWVHHGHRTVTSRAGAYLGQTPFWHPLAGAYHGETAF